MNLARSSIQPSPVAAPAASLPGTEPRLTPVSPRLRQWIRALTAVAVFCLTGELMLRFDARTLFFTNHFHLENTAKESAEMASARSGTLGEFGASFRVMVVGDSYLYGAGVRPEEIFSNRLRNRLNEQHLAGYRDAAVLDVTLPGANTYRNLSSFLEYAPRFRPHAVILAYNANDVYGNQGNSVETRAEAPVPPKVSDEERTLGLAKSIRRAVFSSKLAELLITKANMELKLIGVVVPGTEFAHQVQGSHKPDFPGWIASRKHLEALAAYSRENGIFLLAANMPDLSMLSNQALYQDVDREIARFFREVEIPYVNAAEPFRGRTGETFSISRYDGHPNGQAHGIAADFLSKELIRHFQPGAHQRGEHARTE